MSLLFWGVLIPGNNGDAAACGNPSAARGSSPHGKLTEDPLKMNTEAMKAAFKATSKTRDINLLLEA